MATVGSGASPRFRAPTHVGGGVERRRLLDELNRSPVRQLTVIHAPVGYGKTTLAVQWLDVLQRAGVSVAWLGLHRDDNDAHRFLSHLLEALRGVLAEAGDLGDPVEQDAGDGPEHTVAAVLERVAAHDGTVVLAFDDWHLVDDDAVRRALVRILEFAPPNLAVVLTSRRRPPLPLSRLRVRGELVEIDADALRFDLDETRAFLAERIGPRLDAGDVARLSVGTGGWVAALQLVSLSLRDATDPTALISGFSGRHRSVAEYLAENVLDALPADVLEFLLATSVCDRLCGDLAGVLSGRDDGQAMLEELESRDLFLRPLDAEHAWFCYQHLFADCLRHRLDRDRPGRAVGLHARASAWFARHELVAEAVAHAVAGGDVRGATDLVERHAMPLVEHGRMLGLLGLLGRLPSTAADERPGLLMAVAWANCLVHRGAAARSALDRLRLLLPDGDEHERTRGEADVLQACLDVHGDRTDRAEGLVARGLAGHRTYRPWVVAMAANVRTFCDLHASRFTCAREWQRWAGPFHDRTTGPFAGVQGRCLAGVAALAQLDLTGAQDHLRAAVVPAPGSAGRRSPAAQPAGALLGELHYVRGELDEAERLLEESREPGAPSGVVDVMVAGFALLARIKADRGAADEATALLAEGARVADRLGLIRLRVAVGAERVGQYLARGRIREAHRIVGELPDGSTRPGGTGFRVHQLRTSALAAVYSAEGDQDRAAALLCDLVADASSRGQTRVRVELTVQLAGVRERADRHLAAERTLGEVLTTVVAAGVPQLVHDGGPDVRRVLRRLVARAARTEAAGDVLPPAEHLVGLLGGAERTGECTPLALTGREVEILRMLEVGRSNRQIADALHVTVNTVKWYLKNINGKLGAGNRTAAVSLARRGGLLG